MAIRWDGIGAFSAPAPFHGRYNLAISFADDVEDCRRQMPRWQRPDGQMRKAIQRRVSNAFDAQSG
jgi:hypothetical protein